jgi:thioredoxin reductase (NADPH)
MFFRGQTVAVVGGGNTAVDEAVYLSDICEKVYLIHRRDELRADAFLQTRAFARSNLEIVWDSVPTEVVGSDEVTSIRVRNVKTDEASEIALSGVFVAIGHEPQTEWLTGLLELKDGFIVTNCHMETNAPGVFACGDIRDTPLRQVTTAVGDASIAAHSAWQHVMSMRK